MIGYYSGQTYNSSSFPDPYDSNAKNGIPNEMSAPFVDLYLAKIIDFVPKETHMSIYSKNNDKARPSSRILKDAQYYFEYGKMDLNNIANYKYNIKPENQITIYAKQKINPKYLKYYDIKYDDGIYNNGRVRSGCSGNTHQTNYDTAILNNDKCSISITSLE